MFLSFIKNGVAMKKLFTFSALILLFSLLFTVSAQVGTGKLAGKITDAETGEPLIGANVVILNTTLGAAADLEGNYFILNITPGTYDVQFSYVGYGSKTLQEVRIVPGVTYELNVTLTAGLNLDEIVVTDKKFFEEKSTNTVKVIDASQIQQLPVKGVANIASLQAGVVVADGSGGEDGNATINVRGGRGGEVLYIVDGVPQNDALFGGNNSQVSNAAIDQISFQIGGYEAKYGQAQSGIINVTTKSGNPKYNLFADVVSSQFTDDYGYNMYTASLDGPFIPGNGNHTFFFSAERGWFLDANPKAINVTIPTANIDSPTMPNNASGIWRFTGRTSHSFDPFTLRLGANINTRQVRGYVHSYAKHNSHHNPITEDGNYSFSGRFSHNVSSSSFWNLNVGYKIYESENGDGVWFNDLNAYGDTLVNPEITAQGIRRSLDNIGLFFQAGRVNSGYSRIANNTLNADFDFTAQIDNHLLEVGAGLQYNTLRYYSLVGVERIAIDIRGENAIPYEDRVALQNPFFFGWDVTGQTKTDANESKVVGGINRNVKTEPRNPIITYAYIQDRFELDDLVLNLGVRFDYFDSQARILRSEALPFAFGDPNIFDAEDFVTKDPEFFVSPRIGLGFPVTESTVFHAQYGKFIQQPTLIDVVTSEDDLQGLVKDGNFGVNTGHVNSEETTQYEIGLRQVLGDNAGALNITAFYKNTKGLINTQTIFFQRFVGGQFDRYYRPTNSDFGTVKGVALSLQLSRMSYFSVNLDYTYSLAEGTGSSTSSATTAAFRNDNGETPKVIAPLDFDQRHTGVINVNFYVPKGDLGFFEMTSANILFTFNSGRPYTPLESQNITPGGGSNLGDTKGYVNSAYGPGTSRVDLKIEKSFGIGDNLLLTPYVWIQNLFDTENAVNVYRSTGDPYTSGYLLTEEGKAVAADSGPNYVSDYTALERDPSNFGIPRLIRLGFRLNFSNITF
jgi:outer membrane receptor for ferrienterochelin and colicin